MKKYISIVLFSTTMYASPEIPSTKIDDALLHVNKKISTETVDKNLIIRALKETKKIASSNPALWTYAATPAIMLPLLLSRIVDNYIVITSAAVIGAAGIYPIYRHLRSSTKQGIAEKKFIDAKIALDTKIKEQLKTLSDNLAIINQTYNIDFLSCADAKLCSAKMYATTTHWPLIELRKKMNDYFKGLEEINRQLQSIEKFFSKEKTLVVKQDGVEREISHHDYWQLTKDATAQLTKTLSEKIKYICEDPTLRTQEKKQIDFLEREIDREKAGIQGNIIYNAKYGK